MDDKELLEAAARAAGLTRVTISETPALGLHAWAKSLFDECGSGELSYSYDLLYDIKTAEQLQNEVEYLAHRLGGIARLCRDDGNSIDKYVLAVMEFPNARDDAASAA